MPVAACGGVVLDPTDPTVTAVAAALVVGATSSVHCFAMCGPLACAGVAPQVSAETRNGCAAPAKRAQTVRAIAAYHASRVAAYAAVGGLVGLAGAGAARALQVSVQPVAPWLLAAVLVASALGLARRLTRASIPASIPGIRRVVRAGGRVAARLSPVARGGLLGAMTPLLPCALLWSVVAATGATASAGQGAAILAGFAAGSAPALLLAQAQTGMVRFGKRGASRFVPTVQLVAAAVLIYRAVTLSGPGGPPCH